MCIAKEVHSRLMGVLIAFGALLATGACSGSVGSAEADNVGGSAGAGDLGGGRGPDSPNIDDPDKAPPEAKSGVTLTCSTSGINPGASPLRRLTNNQYRNSISDLFKGIFASPAIDLPSEVAIGGYDNNALAQNPSPALLEKYFATAKSIAAVATAAGALTKVAPCATGANQETCGQAFVSLWAKKIFRRPPTDAELARLNTLFKTSFASDGYNAAVGDTLQAMLSSPQFLYRIETEGTRIANAIQLDHHQVACRLSFLLWDSIPDDELTNAADQGKLGSSAAIGLQVDRMLADPRARTMVAAFQQQWLMLDKVDKLSKSVTAFPKWNDATGTALRESVARYVDHIFWDTGSLTALLTDSHAFVDASSAWVWGVNNAPAKMDLIDVGADRRSGILTQAGLMAAFAKPATDSPVFRGLFVMKQLLCSETGAPPANVPTLATETKPGEAPMTMRQRQTLSHAAPSCAGCHRLIDGIGFGFEHYDAVGGWRDKDNGSTVDATGELMGTSDADGKFDGAVELGAKLSKSVQVQQCVATNWFRWSFGRVETDDDSCALLPIVNSFVSSNGDFKKLIKSIATSDAFRYRQGV